VFNIKQWNLNLVYKELNQKAPVTL